MGDILNSQNLNISSDMNFDDDIELSSNSNHNTIAIFDDSVSTFIKNYIFKLEFLPKSFLIILYIVNIVLNFCVSTDNCISRVNNTYNLSMSTYFFVTGIDELLILVLSLYYFIYIKEYKRNVIKKLTKFEAYTIFIVLLIIFIFNQIWYIIGSDIFFSNYNYYQNNCSYNIYNFMVFEMITEIVFLVSFFSIIVFFHFFLN